LILKHLFVKFLGQQLSYLIIQDLALRKTIPSSLKDEVYESLRCCVCEILEKHSILFHGMVRRFEVNRYHIFSTVADELFEVRYFCDLIDFNDFCLTRFIYIPVIF